MLLRPIAADQILEGSVERSFTRMPKGSCLGSGCGEIVFVADGHGGCLERSSTWITGLTRRGNRAQMNRVCSAGYFRSLPAGDLSSTWLLTMVFEIRRARRYSVRAIRHRRDHAVPMRHPLLVFIDCAIACSRRSQRSTATFRRTQRSDDRKSLVYTRTRMRNRLRSRVDDRCIERVR